MIVQPLSLEKLYETEYDLWLQEMVRVLKARQLEQLDCQNLIEELESLGRSEKNAAKSLLLQIMIHLLLYSFWEAEKEQNVNHWAAEIITFRVQLEDRLTTSIRNYLFNELDSIYENAKLIVEKKTKLSKLPMKCPYSLTELLQKEWFPPSL